MNTSLPPQFKSWLDFYRHLRNRHSDLDSRDTVNFPVPVPSPVSFRMQPFDVKEVKASAFDEIKDNLPTEEDRDNLSDYITAMTSQTSHVDANILSLKLKIEKLAS